MQEQFGFASSVESIKGYQFQEALEIIEEECPEVLDGDERMKYTLKNGNSISIEALAQSCSLSVEDVKIALCDLDHNNFKNPNAIYIASVIDELGTGCKTGY